MGPNYSTVANNNKAYQTNLTNQLGYGAGANFSYGNPSPSGYGSAPELATYKAEPLAEGGSVQGASDGAAYDPNAAARSAASTAFGSQKGNIFSTATEAIGNAGKGLGMNITNYLAQLRNQQQGIDQQGVEAELARQQGLTGILGMVGRGVRSAGVALSNRGAGGASSAADAIARAYGQLGQRQASDVGNQYGLAQNNIATAQKNLAADTGLYQQNFKYSKDQAINGIVSSARQQLASLDAAIAGASLPERINIEQEKQRIQSEAEQALSQYDTQLSQGIGGIQAAGTDKNREKAFQLANAGTAAASPFQYTTSAPGQFNNTGPFNSELPLFSNRTRRTA